MIRSPEFPIPQKYDQHQVVRCLEQRGFTTERLTKQTYLATKGERRLRLTYANVYDDGALACYKRILAEYPVLEWSSANRRQAAGQLPRQLESLDHEIVSTVESIRRAARGLSRDVMHVVARIETDGPFEVGATINSFGQLQGSAPAFDRMCGEYHRLLDFRLTLVDYIICQRYGDVVTRQQYDEALAELAPRWTKPEEKDS